MIEKDKVLETQLDLQISQDLPRKNIIAPLLKSPNFQCWMDLNRNIPICPDCNDVVTIFFEWDPYGNNLEPLPEVYVSCCDKHTERTKQYIKETVEKWKKKLESSKEENSE